MAQVMRECRWDAGWVFGNLEMSRQPQVTMCVVRWSALKQDQQASWDAKPQSCDAA
ncbi:MAG: hypothetical protein MI757_02975 [Pirellulales bacterium]|nr:hypothetical protein [Pirellulales bacterium]